MKGVIALAAARPPTAGASIGKASPVIAFKPEADLSRASANRPSAKSSDTLPAVSVIDAPISGCGLAALSFLFCSASALKLAAVSSAPNWSASKPKPSLNIAYILSRPPPSILDHELACSLYCSGVRKSFKVRSESLVSFFFVCCKPSSSKKEPI